MSWIDNIAKVLPKLKNRIQLIGLIVIIVGYITTKAIVPEQTIAQVSIGAIGILILIFAQFFEYIESFPKNKRAILLITLFVIFSIFIIILIAVSGYFIYSTPKEDKNIISQTNNLKIFDPSMVGYSNSKNVVIEHETTDAELLAVWQNAVSLKSTITDEVTQIDDNTYSTVGISNDAEDNWEIISKRNALLKIAKYILHKFSNEDEIQYSFVNGKIISITYSNENRAATLTFQLFKRENL